MQRSSRKSKGGAAYSQWWARSLSTPLGRDPSVKLLFTDSVRDLGSSAKWLLLSDLHIANETRPSCPGNTLVQRNTSRGQGNLPHDVRQKQR